MPRPQGIKPLGNIKIGHLESKTPIIHRRPSIQHSEEEKRKLHGNIDIAVGKKIGASNIGIGITKEINNHTIISGDISQSRGGKNPFAGKPNTGVGINIRSKF